VNFLPAKKPLPAWVDTGIARSSSACSNRQIERYKMGDCHAVYDRIGRLIPSAGILFVERNDDLSSHGKYRQKSAT
jgi:hypothetical protein